ncbi:MAG: hypothetical protein IJY47_00925 [Clostridia bacterium]|nr:hypothetical protein [Clostridia bacterium]
MKRSLCLVLVLLMLLPMAIACKNEEEKSSGSTTDVAATTGDNGPTNLLDTIPTGNYGGKEFVMAVEDEHELEVKAEELTGETANDTIYKWLQTINSRYGVVVKGSAAEGGVYTLLETETSSGTVTTSLYGINAYGVYRPVQAKMYKNWYSMGDYIDLSAERWDKSVNDNITWNGVLYSLTGDLGYSKLQGAMATFCNVDLLDEIGYTTDDLYKMVDDKEWTFEAFQNIVKDIYIDTDYDNKKSGGDTYGYVATSGNSHDIWFTQFGISITEQNEETNEIEPTLEKQENLDLVDMLWSFYHENPGVFSYSGVQIYGPEDKFFSEGRAAMITTRLSYASQFAEDLGTDAYGILPAPLQNEDQENYYTKLYDRFVTWGVSKSVLDADVDFIAHITDALCAESSQTVYPAFYDILLKQRYSKDPTTARMVDLIMKDVSIDGTFMFSTMLLEYPVLVRQALWNSSKPSLSSSYAGIKNTLPGKLAELYALHQ